MRLVVTLLGIFTILSVLSAVALATMTADEKTIAGVTYQPYGLFNDDAVKDPKVQYEVSLGSVIVACIFSETLVVPVYIVGWDLYEPVRLKR